MRERAQRRTNGRTADTEEPPVLPLPTPARPPKTLYRSPKPIGAPNGEHDTGTYLTPVITADELAARIAGIGSLSPDKLTHWLLDTGLAERVDGGLVATARGVELGAGIA